MWDIGGPSVKSGSDPHGTPNADRSGVRGAESNTGVGSDGEHAEGMSMDVGILLVHLAGTSAAFTHHAAAELMPDLVQAIDGHREGNVGNVGCFVQLCHLYLYLPVRRLILICELEMMPFSNIFFQITSTRSLTLQQREALESELTLALVRNHNGPTPSAEVEAFRAGLQLATGNCSLAKVSL